MIGNDKVVQKLIHQLIASTGLDSENEKIPKEVLKSMYDQMQESNLMWQAHDASLPPVARQYNKSFEATENGEYAIFVDIDIYEKYLFEKYKGFSISFLGKSYTMYKELDPFLEIIFNPKYYITENVKELLDISEEEYPVNVRELHQKGIETLSIFILKFATATFAAKFFQRASSDTYDFFKRKIIDLSNNRKEGASVDSKIHIMYSYKDNKYSYDIMIQCTPEQLKNFEWDDVSLEALHIVLEKLIGESEVVKVAVEMENSQPYWKVLHFVDTEDKVINI